MRLLRNVLSVPTVAAGLWAQRIDKPLTNGEIESMLTAGVPESTILLKIETVACVWRIHKITRQSTCPWRNPICQGNQQLAADG